MGSLTEANVEPQMPSALSKSSSDRSTSSTKSMFVMSGVDEKVAELIKDFDSLQVKRDPKRNEILWLIQMQEKFEELKNSLSKAKYITRNHRNLSIRVLTLYEKVAGEDFEDEIEQLQQPLNTHIKKKNRVKVIECIEKLIATFNGEMKGFRPKDDDERFDAMMGEDCAQEKHQDELILKMEVINFDVNLRIREFKLVGSLDNETFFAEVKKRWGFAEPEKYFNYSGGVKKRPIAIEESIHLSAGTPIESCWGGGITLPFAQGIKGNGSIGAFFFVNEKDLQNLHIITAGHCVEINEPAAAAAAEDIQQQNEDEAYRPHVSIGANDFAVLPLNIPPGTQLWANNPLFNNEIEDWFVENETVFEPGTVVMKVGATTGVTHGKLIGVKCVHFKGMRVKDVLVQWDAGERFTSGGDSGSVYYAIRGNKKYPIAVHRGQTEFLEDSYLTPGEKTRTVVSVGTPFSRVKRLLDYYYPTIIWFDNFTGTCVFQAPMPETPEQNADY